MTLSFDYVILIAQGISLEIQKAVSGKKGEDKNNNDKKQKKYKRSFP